MPKSAPSRCTDPSCGEMATFRGRCEQHQRPAWQRRTSDAERYDASGSSRAKLHASVIAEAAGICYVCGEPGADQCDHILPVSEGGSPRDRANLGAIHADPCHRDKTKREAARGRARARERRRLEAQPPPF